MTKHNRPKYLKREKFSVSLPGWQRLLFAAISPDSTSRALSRLVAEAIKRGALADIAPSLPPYTDLTELAAYLTGRPLMPAAPAPLYNPAPATQPAHVVTAPPAPAPAPYIAPATTLTAPNLSPELADPFADWDDDSTAPSEAAYIAVRDAARAAQATTAPAVDAWDKPADQLTEADQRAIMQRIEREMDANR